VSLEVMGTGSRAAKTMVTTAAVDRSLSYRPDYRRGR
jgi:hypothetical protein